MALVGRVFSCMRQGGYIAIGTALLEQARGGGCGAGRNDVKLQKGIAKRKDGVRIREAVVGNTSSTQKDLVIAK